MVNSQITSKEVVSSILDKIGTFILVFVGESVKT